MKTKTSSKKSKAVSTKAPAVPERTIGVDLGDVKHAVCVLDRDGETVEQRTITSHRESLRRLSKKYPNARVVMEVDSPSPWHPGRAFLSTGRGKSCFIRTHE